MFRYLCKSMGILRFFSHSLLDAEASCTKLCNMVSQVLDSNKELLARLRRLEGISAAAQQAGPSNIDQQAFSARIEEDLINPQVYRNIYSHFQLPASVSRPDHAFSINTAISMGEVPDICSISLPLLPEAISNAHWYTKDLPSVYDIESAQVLGQSSRTKQNDNPSNLEADHAAVRSTSQANNLNTSEVNTTQSPNERRTCWCDTASGGSGTQRSFVCSHNIRDPPLIHFSGLNSLEHIQASVNGRSYLIPKNGVPITIEVYASEPLPRISRKVAQKMQSQVAVEDISNVRLGTARHRHSVPAHVTPSFKHKDRTGGPLESPTCSDRENDPGLIRRSSPHRRPRAINLSTETVEVPHSRYNNPGYRANDRIPRSCPSSLPPSLTILSPKEARHKPDPLHSLERQADKKPKYHQLENHRPRLRRRSMISENELTQRHDQSAWESSDTDHDYTTRRSARQRNHSRGRRQFETPPPPYRESISRNRLTKRPPLIATESSPSIHPYTYEARNDAFSSYDQQTRPSSRRNNKPPVSRIWDPEQRWQQDSDTEQRQGRDESRGRGVLRGLVERGKSLRSRSRLVMP